MPRHELLPCALARARMEQVGVSGLILLCPTYGDAEFESGFEQFLRTVPWARFSGCSFAFCEVGIYTGYEDFGHGLDRQLSTRLLEAGLVKVAPTLSLDAVPITDWPLLERWCELVAQGMGTGT